MPQEKPIFTPDRDNARFALAADLVTSTSQHIFLTGKAGTGKTTFLRYIREQTGKNVVVVAPTGVAAINAGGVTMHSQFQLPFGPFVPGTYRRDGPQEYVDVTDKQSFFRNIRWAKAKQDVYKELELLVIDEVSMMRADALDAIDTVLRHFRRQPHLPFGGVQVLYIGDMFQLPPVAQPQEWEILKEYYDTPFFFSAHAIREAPPLYIELNKIYRQEDQHFIDLLNRIRNGVPSTADLQLLNAKIDPAFQSPPDKHYITLCSHNRRADDINAAALQRLTGTPHVYKAEIDGEFSDKAYPTDPALTLKEGAQIMFIKNDAGGERRWYNGRLATVLRISTEGVRVRCTDDGTELDLVKEKWKNLRYTYNREEDKIDEEELGSFTQFPVRLAWAITIHKSQGLTFERAVIDAGQAFAPGQVYVALSRCTNLEGMVLRSRIGAHSISTDPRVIAFAGTETNGEELEAILEREKYKHWSAALVKTFDFGKVIEAIGEWRRIVPEKKIPDAEGALTLADDLIAKARKLQTHAQKFGAQLATITAAGPATDLSLLTSRMHAAIPWMGNAIAADLLRPLNAYLAGIAQGKGLLKYREEVKKASAAIWAQQQKITGAHWGKLLFQTGVDFSADDPGRIQTAQREKKGKLVKGESAATSLAMFKGGKSMEDIALERNLSPNTIMTHLMEYLPSGEIAATDLLPAEKLAAISKVIAAIGSTNSTDIKERLGDEYSYSDVRVGVAQWKLVTGESGEA